ncbi:arsenical pump membrane protein-domain-containing protein [Fimicolochytrium jonesii]|uniref:arsenical pump membrane protein-domain-containing protein n=1 Tax=Fimicolochytrium jonesii TaxID=1396493 RepID=UPI0022FDBC5D|nr:arsenical pump membrane protein-domain-containing protein [Fimicolochytrium jonesii]KAI8819692.1 arsenical pump membrane protein-domain-containing protein [Fimicolochytrium jonesii]
MKLALDLATAPVLGVLILWATTSIDGGVVRDGIVGDPASIQPFSVVILVFALAYICISIDVTGFFAYVAFQVAKRGGASGTSLFRNLYILSTIMTIFTSNDVVVLTVTPIVCYLTAETKTDPTSYLFSTFIACNIASMALYIGNPTNIIVAQAYDINFLQYSAWMILPTIAGLLTAYILCYYTLRSLIPPTIPPPPAEAEERYKVERKWDAVFGCAVLGVCLVALMVVPLFAHVAVWILTAPFAGVMLVKDDVEMEAVPAVASYSDRGVLTRSASRSRIHHTPPPAHTPPHHDSATSLKDSSLHPPTSTTHLHMPPTGPTTSSSTHRPPPTTPEILLRLPYPLIPFCFGMFILCEAFSHTGWVALLARALAHTSAGGHLIPIVFITGAVTTLACNVMNNLPMAILFARAEDHHAHVDALRRGGMFALIVGSNLGANLLFIGSLAGLMWSQLLEKRGVRVSQGMFLRKCVRITPVVVVACCAVLCAELAVMGFYV